MNALTPTRYVLNAVQHERWRQETLFPSGRLLENNSPAREHIAVLTEEIGEAARAYIEGDWPQAEVELIQVAAVAVAMVEGIRKFRTQVTA